jgi:hypothetical protein
LTRSAARGALALAVAALLAAPAEARRKTKPSKADVEETDAAETAEDSEPASAKDDSEKEVASEDEPSEDQGTRRKKRSKVRKRARAPEPEPDAESDTTETTPPNALELGVGGMALFRSLSWTADADAAGLGPYSLTPGPEAGVWLEFFPAAFATDGFAANIGLYARYDHGFGASTKTQAGGDVATTYEGFVGGLKLRFPLGTFTPFASLGYGNQSFRIAAENSPADLPGVAYSFVRIGAGTRVQFTPDVSMDVGLAYLPVTDPGSAPGLVASPTFFPRAKAYGVDFGASVHIHLTSAIGLRGGLDWRQYGLAFYPRTGDPATRLVKGASDRYIVTWVGLEVSLARGGGKLEAPAAADDE